MTLTSAGWLAARMALPLTAAVLALGLTACQPGQALAGSTATPASSPSTVDSAPASSAPASSASASPAATVTAVPSAAGGSLTTTVSAPVTVAGTAEAPVTCLIGRAYRAVASRATINGNELSVNVLITGYHGPGSYPALVAVTLHQASGVVTTLAGVPRVPAVITGTGGSFTVSAVGREGRRFTGQVSWVCAP
jgi:hypothetical protein